MSINQTYLNLYPINTSAVGFTLSKLRTTCHLHYTEYGRSLITLLLKVLEGHHKDELKGYGI
jgi:hypothetical protein